MKITELERDFLNFLTARSIHSEHKKIVDLINEYVDGAEGEPLEEVLRWLPKFLREIAHAAEMGAQAMEEFLSNHDLKPMPYP